LLAKPCLILEHLKVVEAGEDAQLIGRMGTIEEMGQACLFLAAEGTFCTGIGNPLTYCILVYNSIISSCVVLLHFIFSFVQVYVRPATLFKCAMKNEQ
jgi:hypothetical protein